jgi:hypothetical protein
MLAALTFGEGRPLKRFIILASFCQIYYPAVRRGVTDARCANLWRGPAIEKVHYFGFVLQICAPDRIPQADRVGIATPTTARAADPTLMCWRPSPSTQGRDRVRQTRDAR